VHAGVYAVGRPQLDRHGTWMAAVLACGPTAALSHASAAALWQIADREGADPEVSVPASLSRRRPGIVVHRRYALDAATTTVHLNIRVTKPARTILDLATTIPRRGLEAAIAEADKRDLIDFEALRAAVADLAGLPGVRALRAALDRDTYSRTDSELERRFLALARRSGLPRPLTQVLVDGRRVDFFWPELGLVVETDGLRYHRTPAQQAEDRRRDQAHTAAGRTVLRFTHAQVVREPQATRATLLAVARRLRQAG
jgi:very-short-patch-repair endonuclease